MLALLLLVVACGGEEKKPEELQKAFALHEEAVKIRQEAKDQLGTLTAISDSVFIAANQENLNALAASLEEWDEQLVEVPGFEEEHDHSGHDHAGHDHHHHDSGPELTPKEHLEVQQHLLDEIKALAAKLNQIEA